MAASSSRGSSKSMPLTFTCHSSAFAEDTIQRQATLENVIVAAKREERPPSLHSFIRLSPPMMYKSR